MPESPNSAARSVAAPAAGHGTPDASAEAFERVVAAEQAAQAAVAAARQQAAELLAQARAREQAISDRVDTLIEHWRHRTANRARSKIAELDAEAARLEHLSASASPASEPIGRAVARLAAELTGSS